MLLAVNRQQHSYLGAALPFAIWGLWICMQERVGIGSMQYAYMQVAHTEAHPHQQHIPPPLVPPGLGGDIAFHLGGAIFVQLNPLQYLRGLSPQQEGWRHIYLHSSVCIAVMAVLWAVHCLLPSQTFVHCKSQSPTGPALKYIAQTKIKWKKKFKFHNMKHEQIFRTRA